MEFSHTPILLSEVVELLNVQPGGTYVDGTLGGGGHTFRILEMSSPDGISIGIDKDEKAIAAAGERCATFPGRLLTIHGDFMKMKELLPEKYLGRVDGILLDLGVSSYQLDNAARGFSYMKEGKLDMRMDAGAGLSAFDVVNSYSKEELTRIFKTYGEEKWSSRIAEFICQAREKQPVETTGELVDIIKAAIPAAARRTGPHPATRVFQAIRIEVNGELEELGDSIFEMIEDVLKPGARIGVITFHSLEDRIVKRAFQRAQNPCQCPPKAPCVCGKQPLGKILTRKPVTPGAEELANNPRARSAKLRVFEKKEQE